MVDAEFLDYHVNKSTVGFYFHLGKKLLDVLVLSDQSRLQVPIKRGVNTNEKLVLVAKNLGEDEERHGSVTFLLESYFGEASAHPVEIGRPYTQWITLFDHPDDDVYDGILLENDEEVPRVQIEFTVTYATADARSSTADPAKRAVAKDNDQARGKDRSPANARKDSAKGDVNNMTQKVGQNLKDRTSQARASN